MLHWSIVTHAKAREGALGALWVERQVDVRQVDADLLRLKLACLLGKANDNWSSVPSAAFICA